MSRRAPFGPTALLLTGALVGAVAIASCSDDSSKKDRPETMAGAAGEAGIAGEMSQNGGVGGEQSAIAASGAGGIDLGAGGGGGAAGGDAAAGVGGAPGPAPLFLFTVDSTSTGLASTAVAASRNPQGIVFSAVTPSPDPVNGRNLVQLDAAALGLADTDAIDAIAALQPAPSHAVYWFSVAANRDNAEGERPTRLARSSADGEAIGDVYFSDATLSFRSLGTSGDQLGYNGLVADEQSLGLSPAAPSAGHLDNLTGVQIFPSGQLPSRLYFSVTDRAQGLANSAVAATTDAQRACTVFESALDGTNSVAFSCADLGLAASSDVTGLVVYGASRPSEVLFAVGLGSTGLRGTAVADASSVLSNVYASSLDGTNTLRAAGAALGLSSDDQLDALTVVDRAPAAYPYSSTCRLTPAPDTAEGAGIASFQSAHRLGDLILVVGPASATSPLDSVGAYDLKTCSFVARSTATKNALVGHTWAPVPLAGWSADAPFAKLEYWTLASDGSGVTRLDASGAELASYDFATIATSTYAGFTLDYDPAHDRFFAVLDPQTGVGGFQRLAFTRPAGVSPGSVSDLTLVPIPHPCAYSPQLSGVDAHGSSVYAQFNTGTDTDFRVCTLSANSGEFTDLPFTWSLQTQVPDYAVLIPEDALYALFEDDAYAVERYALTL